MVGVVRKKTECGSLANVHSGSEAGYFESESSTEITKLIQEIRECLSNPVPNSLEAACELVTKTESRDQLVQRPDVSALALKAYQELLENNGVTLECLKTALEFRSVFKLSTDLLAEIEQNYYLSCVRNCRLECLEGARKLLGSRELDRKEEVEAIMTAYISRVCSGREEEAEDLVEQLDFTPPLTLADILERS